MQQLVDHIVQAVTEWEDINVEPHRFGGREFRIGKMEIGHIHNHGLVDVPFTRRIREQLVLENAAQAHYVLPESGWISYYIHSEADIEQALWLLRLSYMQKQRNRYRRNPDELQAFDKGLNDLALSPNLRKILN